MASADQVETMTFKDREEWVLAQIERPDIPTDRLVEALDALWHSEQREGADSLSELLLEALIEKGAADDALRILLLRTRWHAGEPGWREQCKREAVRILESERERRVLADEVGFQGNVSLETCVRRLRKLMRLRPGTLCYDKTWGFGVVSEVDLFYRRTRIDFEYRRHHEMALSYAAETLKLIDDDHLMARNYRDPEAVRRQVEEDPAEVVRMCLRSYGPLPVPQLKEKLTPAIVAEADWKRFWDAARKELKKDPLVEVPSKRSEPVQLLGKAPVFDEDWFRELAGERDLERIINAVQAYNADAGKEEPTDEERGVLLDRLAFVVKGADPDRPGVMAQAFLEARALGLGETLGERTRPAEDFFEPVLFRRAASALPARQVPAFLELLVRLDRERALDWLYECVPELEIGVLGEAVELLVREGREEACAAVFRERLAQLTASTEMLNWLLRNQERMAAWGLASLPGIAHQVLARLEDDSAGERRRAQNQLREYFSRDEWFLRALESMNEAQRRDFLHRLKDSPGFSTMDRRSLLGRAIKAYPELQEVTASRARTARKRGPVTSTRSYRERQARLERMVNVEIPENSKEIAVARSYGDLRENHEYKAAKEMQGILMRRQAELEKMLSEVRPTDFRQPVPERAGIGTRVELAYPDGSREIYHILGEWDRDEQLHIIACNTRMARALTGHKTGDEVRVPTESAEQVCTITNVAGLPEEVYEWIDAEADSPRARQDPPAAEQP